MQTYDVIMLTVLICLTIYGYFKGMAWQLAYFCSFIVSYFVSLRFSDQLAPMFGQPPLNRFIAMLVIYVICSLAIWTAFRMVRGAINKVRLESFDHQMGAVVGLARGVLWCVGITFFAVTLLPAAQKQSIVGSRAGHYIVALLDKTESVVPPEIHQVIGPYLDRINNRLDPRNVNSGYRADGQQAFPSGGGLPAAFDTAAEAVRSQLAERPSNQQFSWPAETRQPASQPNYQQPNSRPSNYQQPSYQQPNYRQPNYQQPASRTQPSSRPATNAWPASTQQNGAANQNRFAWPDETRN